MEKIADIYLRDNVFYVEGELDFSNVSDLFNKSLLMLLDLDEYIFDFSKVTSTNSAGIALLIEWIKFANHHQKKLTCLSLPENLLAIAKVGKFDLLIKKYCN